jgi:hypothetical protein
MGWGRLRSGKVHRSDQPDTAWKKNASGPFFGLKNVPELWPLGASANALASPIRYDGWADKHHSHSLPDHRPISVTMAVESGGHTIWCFAHVGFDQVIKGC